jgi:VIT1/CCC1 family predicted Fe2+/Mn2+ transporter
VMWGPDWRDGDPVSMFRQMIAVVIALSLTHSVGHAVADLLL